MKKVILSLALMIGLGATHSYAQTTFGVKAEANISNYILSDMGGAKSKMGVGANIGGFVNFQINNWFAIQPELMFTLQNSKLEQGNIDSKVRGFGMEVPVYAMFGLQSANGGRAYIGVGPDFRLGFSAKDRTSDINLYKGSGHLLQRGDVGVAAIIGYEFSNRIQINATYKYGLLNQVNSGSGTMQNQAISLGLGYRF